MIRDANAAGLAGIALAGVLCGCGGGGGGGAASTAVWTEQSQIIDLGCFNFFSGSMRFSATRDQLSADQQALLSNLRSVDAAPGCLEDATSCQITVTDLAGSEIMMDAMEMDAGCGTARRVVSFQSLQPFLQSLGCQYAKNLTFGSANPVPADVRCFNGLFTATTALRSW